MDEPSSVSALELATLRGRLAEAEDMLRAIRAGEVDAIVVNGENAPAVYTLKGASDPYRLLVEQMSEGALTISSEGVILYCNAAFAQMVEQGRERLVGTLVTALALDDDETTLARLIAGAERTSQAIRLVRSDGATLHTQFSSSPMALEGEPIHCLVVTDLSRQELRAQHEAIVKASVDAIYSLRLDGTITSWNAGAERLYGYPANEAIGRNIRMVIPPERLAHLEIVFDRISQDQTVWFEAAVITKSGSKVETALSLSPIPDGHGHVSAVAAIARDVSERKLAQAALETAKVKAERADLAKSQLLAAASHDLRQPVQSLTLLLSVIKRKASGNPEISKAATMAETAVNSLTGLLGGILDISKLDAGVVRPLITSVDLGELTENLANEYRPRAEAKGLAFRFAPTSLRAHADYEMVERVLRNLLENALRYTAKGAVLLGVRRRGEIVRLDVIDTGIGIPAEKQSEIFEEFRQLDNFSRDSSQGLGLGLAIVSRLCRLLGTEVEVASRLGHGSRFSIGFPLDRTPPRWSRAARTFDDPGGRVLVIEDNLGLRSAYEIMLNDWGYPTLLAATAEEALERAARDNWRFDAIIADHRLGPGLNGAAAAAEIMRRAGRFIPTAIITGDTANERIVEIHKSGFEVLYKPVEAADLRQCLAGLLHRGAAAIPSSTTRRPAI